MSEIFTRDGALMTVVIVALEREVLVLGKRLPAVLSSSSQRGGSGELLAGLLQWFR